MFIALRLCESSGDPSRAYK